MTAEFPAEPPASGLFEATEAAEPATPADSDFLRSLIAEAKAADSAE